MASAVWASECEHVRHLQARIKAAFLNIKFIVMNQQVFKFGLKKDFLITFDSPS